MNISARNNLENDMPGSVNNKQTVGTTEVFKFEDTIGDSARR